MISYYEKYCPHCQKETVFLVVMTPDRVHKKVIVSDNCQVCQKGGAKVI